jgi:hypothetical protein
VEVRLLQEVVEMEFQETLVMVTEQEQVQVAAAVALGLMAESKSLIKGTPFLLQKK